MRLLREVAEAAVLALLQLLRPNARTGAGHVQ